MNNFYWIAWLIVGPAVILGTLAPAIVVELSNRQERYARRTRKKRSSILFNSTHVEKECYSKPENIYKVLDDANIKPNFLKETKNEILN